MKMTKTLWGATLLLALYCGCMTTPQQARETEIRRRLADTVIPEIEFRQAHIHCPIAFLQAQSRTNATDQGINIVLMDPFESSSDTSNLITLDARNISIGEALNIICELGGFAWEIEDSVVKVRLKRVQPVVGGDVEPSPQR